MNLNKDILENKWDEFRQNIRNRWNKRRNEWLIKAKANRVQERSISILQNRYGYTREKALSELNKHYSKAWLG